MGTRADQGIGVNYNKISHQGCQTLSGPSLCVASRTIVSVSGVSREESLPYQNVIGKFHFGGIAAHVNSVRMGDFRELLFGTALKVRHLHGGDGDCGEPEA